MARGTAHQKRKRASDGSASSKKTKKVANGGPALSAEDERAVDAELKRVNDLLQKEETSQKRTSLAGGAARWWRGSWYLAQLALSLRRVVLVRQQKRGRSASV